MTASCDVLVIGGGVAGTSLAAALAGRLQVVVCEAEPVADRHSTGRSAALLIPSYGNAVVRALTTAGLSWWDAPDGTRDDDPLLLAPRPVLWVTGPGSGHRRAALLAETAATGHRLDEVDRAQARAMFAPLREQWSYGALVDHAAQEIDVAALMAVLRRRLRAAGGAQRLSAGVVALRRRTTGWRVTLADGEQIEAGTVVDAAGAWADQVARLAGIRPLGLVPCRRTLAACPVDIPTIGWPLVSCTDETFYLRPEPGSVLVSPADETPDGPGDARPDELDVASGLEGARAATTLPLRSVTRAWAGLRTFAPDRTPVLGPDQADPTFVWCAGQGGYGIQTAPGAAALLAAVLLGEDPPAGLDPAALAPSRPGLAHR